MTRPSKLPPRSFDDVWLEISKKALEYKRTKRPIVTLKRGYRNWITGVTENKIERLSEKAKNKNNPANPRRGEVEGIWNSLVRHQAAEHRHLEPKGYGLYFVWALMKTCLNGLRFIPDSFRLEVADWNQLMTPYAEQKKREVEFKRRARAGRTFRGGRGGGESDEHKAIKQAVYDDPLKWLGEPMTSMEIEKPFITGDQLDVLLQDRRGRLVCVEVEVDIGPNDDIGFHQAAKYRVLCALENGLAPEEVRAFVVARMLDHNLVKKYKKFGIEARTCQT